MSRRRIVAVAATVVLALPGLMGGSVFAACLHDAPMAHQCCAMRPAGSAGNVHDPMGCEGRAGVEAGVLEPARECGCSHTPELPADINKAGPSAAPEPTTSTAAIVGALPAPTAAPSTSGCPSWRGPPEAAAHLFLVDCAFLI